MKILRNKARLTQKELSIRTGISQNYISEIENGHIGGLTISKLIKIANVLRVTPEELLRRLLANKNKLNI